MGWRRSIIIRSIPFQANHDGKCDSCEEVKPLDTMVRKSYQKGLYECIDCKVDHEIVNIKYLYPKSIIQQQESNLTRIQRLRQWVMG